MKLTLHGTSWSGVAVRVVLALVLIGCTTVPRGTALDSKVTTAVVQPEVGGWIPACGIAVLKHPGQRQSWCAAGAGMASMSHAEST